MRARVLQSAAILGGERGGSGSDNFGSLLAIPPKLDQDKRTRARNAWLALGIAATVLLGTAPRGVFAATEEPPSPRVAVVVLLSEPSRESGRADTRAPAERVSRLLAKVPAREMTVTRRFESLPGFAAEVALSALRRLQADREVAAVTRDGVVRPAEMPQASGFVSPGPMPSGQPGTAQIGADRFAALGLTGSSRTVAVIDTGIDAKHPAFTPNASGPKILGGWNVVSDDEDISDCDGHGTSVAGVVAGPSGVAPAARLVALRVFGAAGDCRTARFSDVLGAMDWAIRHRDDYDIDTVNLSVAGEVGKPAERSGSGFCDSQDPNAARFFARARAAGIAVVAASGNDGHKDTMPWPACLSDVISVGMVYSGEEAGPIPWGGAASCVDSAGVADGVSCASNSAQALSLLAPGFRWLAPLRGGGQTALFSGTSAAAPAVAGALVLLRQARPLEDPALAAELLRATGHFVLDPLASRVTPRLDLSAALDGRSPFSGACSEGPAAEGGPGARVCETEVSGIATPIASLRLSLSVESEDPARLTVALTAPDGRRVPLAMHTAREVFGAPLVDGAVGVASPDALAAFTGHKAAGRWRLTVTDPAPGKAPRVVSWALHVQPLEVPRAPVSGPSRSTRVLAPIVGQPGRAGAFFRTDVRLFNTDPFAAHDAMLYFAGTSRSRVGDATALPRTAVTLPPMSTRRLDDIVGDLFGVLDWGALLLDAPGEIVASARIATTAAAGSRRAFFVPESTRGEDEVVLGAPSLVLLPPPVASQTRLNVGLAEVSGEPAVVEVSVRDAAGAPRGALRRYLDGYTATQVGGLHEILGLPKEAGDRVGVEVVEGQGRVSAYTVALDNTTGDGLFVRPARAQGEIVLAGAARAAGRFGAFFRSDLAVFNPSPEPTRILASFTPQDGPAPGPVVFSVGAESVRPDRDALESLFGLGTSDLSGVLRLVPLDGTSLLASGRTYDASAEGRVGAALSPLTDEDQVGPGGSLALTFLAETSATRTNLVFVETRGLATSAELTIKNDAGEELARVPLNVPAHGVVQWNAPLERLGLSPLADASALLTVLDGGALAALVSRNENRTGSASVLKATPIRDGAGAVRSSDRQLPRSGSLARAGGEGPRMSQTPLRAQ